MVVIMILVCLIDNQKNMHRVPYSLLHRVCQNHWGGINIAGEFGTRVPMTPPHTVLLPSAITRANLIGQFNPEWGIKAAYSFSSTSRLDLGKVRSQWSFVKGFFRV